MAAAIVPHPFPVLFEPITSGWQEAGHRRSLCTISGSVVCLIKESHDIQFEHLTGTSLIAETLEILLLCAVKVLLIHQDNDLVYDLFTLLFTANSTQ